MAVFPGGVPTFPTRANATVIDASHLNGPGDEITALATYLLSASQTFDVKQFPYLALLDGAADDTTAINSAITACSAAGGGIVLIPVGTGIVTNIVGASNVTLQGMGRSVSILKRKNSTAGNASIIDFVGKSNFTVRDLALDGNKSNQTSAASNITIGTSFSWTLERVTSINAKAVSGGYGAGISIVDGTNDSSINTSHIRECQCVGNDGSGMFINKEHFINISGNSCKQNGNGGILLINYVFPPVAGVQNYVSISGNICHGNVGSGINFNGFYEGGSSSAPIYGPGVPSTQFCTITDNKCIGNTVYGIVYAGSYGTVSGNICNSNGSAGGGAGFLFDGAHSSLIGNVTYDNGFYGVDAGGATECIIANNQFVADGLTSASGRGIGLGASQNMIVRGNMISFLGSTGTYVGIEAAGVDGVGGGASNDPIPFLGSELVIDGNMIRSNGVAGVIGVYLRWQYGRVTVCNNYATNFATNHEAYILGVSDVVQYNNQDARTFGLSGGPLWRITAASTTVIPDFGERFCMTGTTTITNIATASSNVYTGKVRHVTITNGGSGYSQGSPPGVIFTGGGGSSAAGTAHISHAGLVIGIEMTNNGSGYTSAPAVSFSSGTAAGTAVVGCNNYEGRQITLLFSEALTVTDGGNLKIAGNLTATALGASLTLIGLFENWYEIGRTSGL